MAAKKKRKIKFSLRNLIIFFVLAAIVLGYWFSTSHSTRLNRGVQDEYTVLAQKDLEENYPETPREVVKFYSRIVKYLYKGKLPDKKTETLVKQMRCLFDDKLLESNPLDQQTKKLKKEIGAYQFSNKRIINYEVAEKPQQTGKVDGVECTTIIASFSIKHKRQKYLRTNEQFLLRKNADGQWKIAGWQLADEGTDSVTDEPA